MTHLIYTAEDNQDDREIELITSNNGTPIAAHIRDVATAQDLYDHVVLTVADLPSPVGGFHELTTGSWAFPASLDLGSNGLSVAAGQNVYMKGFGWDKVIVSTASSLLRITGTALVQGMALDPNGCNQTVDIFGATYAEVRDCMVLSGSTYGIFIRSSTGEALLIDNTVTATNDGLRIAASTTASNIRARGGYYNGTNGNGLDFAGTCGRCSIMQGTYNGSINGVQRASGTQTAVQFIGNWIVGGATGINWPAANPPTRGLVAIGNDFVSAATLAGHTPATAGFNYKANTDTGGLFTETAIVP